MPLEELKQGGLLVMKRLHIITKPTAVNDLADIDADNYGGTWELRIERLEAKRMRQFKQRQV